MSPVFTGPHVTLANAFLVGASAFTAARLSITRVEPMKAESVNLVTAGALIRPDLDRLDPPEDHRFLWTSFQGLQQLLHAKSRRPEIARALLTVDTALKYVPKEPFARAAEQAARHYQQLSDRPAGPPVQVVERTPPGRELGQRLADELVACYANEGRRFRSQGDWEMTALAFVRWSIQHRHANLMALVNGANIALDIECLPGLRRVLGYDRLQMAALCGAISLAKRDTASRAIWNALHLR